MSNQDYSITFTGFLVHVDTVEFMHLVRKLWPKSSEGYGCITSDLSGDMTVTSDDHEALITLRHNVLFKVMGLSVVEQEVGS